MLDAMTTILEKVKDIPGLMTPEELSLLCRMARSASSIILELGSYKGRSLAAMGLTNPNAKLYGIDWFGDMSHRGYQGSTLKETQGNLEKHGVKAEFIIGTTDEAVGQFEKMVDLLHIDAGHSYEECTNDLKNYTPKVNPGGAVCVHDYGKPHNSKLSRPEVQQAVDDWRNDGWTEVERAGTMIAFRKIVAEEGVLYIAYGEKAVANAEQSIASLKERAPRLMVAVASDQQVKGADIWIKHVDIDRGARNVKTRMYAISPFRKTLYLDADTIVLSDPAHGFKMLELVDLVMGQDAVRIFNRTTWAALDKEEVATTKSETDGGELCYYNSGVIFFRRSDAMRQLMQAWHKEWLRWGKQDQPGMLRAMYKHPVRMASMRAPWNTHHQADAKFIFHAHRRASREGAPK